MRPHPRDGRSARIQSKIDLGYRKAAQVLGQPFYLYRPTPWIESFDDVPESDGVVADFTNAKSSGFNYDKSIGFDDMLWHALVDGVRCEVGDVLIGARLVDQDKPPVYFIAAMPALKPIICVRCTNTITLSRSNSQIDEDGGQAEGLPSQDGGTGRYWGTTTTPDLDDQGPGEQTIVRNVPCAMVSAAGRSSEIGQTPSDAHGPSRWRFYLPPSVFPQGSVLGRDILTDGQGKRHQINANGWTPLGYRIEATRLEN